MKYDFRVEDFRGLLAFAIPKDVTPPNFAEKTFANSHKTPNSRKFSPSKVFRYTVYQLWEVVCGHLSMSGMMVHAYSQH